MNESSELSNMVVNYWYLSLCKIVESLLLPLEEVI